MDEQSKIYHAVLQQTVFFTICSETIITSSNSITSPDVICQQIFADDKNT